MDLFIEDSEPLYIEGAEEIILYTENNSNIELSLPHDPEIPLMNHLLLSNIGVYSHAIIDSHIDNNSNPHNVTKAQVGLSNVDNTSDDNKPVSGPQGTAIATAIANLVNSAPSTLDTLKELADALGDDPNFATTMTSTLASKAPLIHTHVMADITDLAASVAIHDAANRDRANHTGTQSSTTIIDSVDKRFVTDADLGIIANQSGINTGDQDLSGKADLVHYHSLNDLTQTGATNGQVPLWSGTHWVPSTPSSGGGTWGSITGTLSSQTDLQAALNAKVDENSPIIGATKTKITYDSKGLVTSGIDATTADITDSTNKRYVTDAELVIIGNTSGTNTGDQNLIGLVPKTTTVNGHALSTNVTVTQSDIGLGSVDNTSDLAKPISTATQTALDLKLNIIDFVPGGINKQVQFNDSGSFNGSELYYDKINERLGIQVTSPTVPLHIDNNIAQTVALPSGISHTLTLDPSVDSPVSYSISEVTVPDGSLSAIGFSQADDPSYGFLADASININVTIYPYKIINGSTYYTGTSSVSVTDNSDGQTCGFNYTWTPIGGIDGYVLVSSGTASQGNPNWIIDVGNTSSYLDTGASSSNSGTPTPFSSICFPYQPTTGYSDPTSGSAGFTSDGSGQISSGSDWQVYVYGYVTIYGQNYYSSTPYMIDLGIDPNDGNNYAASGSFSGGTYPNYIAILNIGGVVAGQDLGSGTSFYITTQIATTITPQLVSYSGTTWSNSAYGKITSPSTKYSITHNDQSITDSNPVTGYIFLNTFATFGNATDLKVIATTPSSRSNGYIYNGSIVGSFYQINTGLGDSIVTPSTIGFLATGQTQLYDFYTKLNIYGADTYSPSATTETVIYPNDGQYYVVTFAGTFPSGATLKINKVGTGWQEQPNFSYVIDNTIATWGGSSTVTPNSAYSPTAFIDWDSRHLTSTNTTPMQIRDHNTALVPRIIMAAYYGGIGQMQAGWGYSANQNFVFDSYNHGLEIGVLGTPDYIFTPTQAIFNNNITSSINLVFKGGGGNTVLTANSNINTLQLGYVNYNYDTFSALSIQPYNSDSGLIFYPNPSAPTSAYQWAVQNSSASVMSSVNSIGHMGVGGVSSSADSRLYIGAGNNSVAQIKFQSTASLPSGAVPYGLSVMSDKLWFSDSAATYKSLLTSLSSSTAGNYWFSDSLGNPSAASGISTNGSSLITINSSFILFAQGGLSVASGKDLTMGSSSRFLGAFRPNIASISANTTLNAANHSPFTEFTGSTSGRTITLPTAASISGIQYNIYNRSSVSVTVATTSSQAMNYAGGVPTSIVLQPGDMIYNTATASSTWDSVVIQNITSTTRGGVIAGSKTATGTATTTFTVTIGSTQPNATYKVAVTPSNALSAALYYVNNKTTTTFDVVYLAGLTGAVAFDWILTN